MSEPEMYPLVDNPSFEEFYESFADLRADAEGLSTGLNFPLSWSIYDEQDEDWKDGEGRDFSLCIFMPRKGKTTVWSTSTFDRAEVQEWLDTFIKAKVMEWYGWAE